MNFSELKNQHSELLEKLNDKRIKRSELAIDIEKHLKDIALSGETIYANNERAMLLADIRFWSSVFFDIEKRYPEKVQLLPVRYDLNLTGRLESVKKSLQSGCNLRAAAVEIAILRNLIKELSSNESAQDQLIETEDLLESKKEEQSALLDRIRQGKTEEVALVGIELERLLAQKVTEIYDGDGRPVIPIEQAITGIKLRLQIQKAQAIVQLGWTQILVLLSNPDSRTEQWWNDLQQIEIPASNSEGVSFLGSNFDIEIQKLKEIIPFQQDLYKTSQKIAQTPAHFQKAFLLKDLIAVVEHSSKVISPYDFRKQLREIAIKEIRIVLEQAWQKFKEGNYQEARDYSNLILYFVPEDEETILLVRNIDQAITQQKEQENEHRQLEADLWQAAHSPRNLTALYELIIKVEEIESQQAISSHGLEALKKARQVYEEGLKRQRELTLKVYNGTLQERFDAIATIREMITAGETQIWDAPAGMWRPASKVLSDAERKHQHASIAQVDDLLKQADDRIKIRPALALQFLYTALNKKIPYVEADRRRLESYYLEIYRSRGRLLPPSQDDQAGYKLIQQLYEQRLRQSFNSGATWLNQFFHSAIGSNAAGLLDKAASEDTEVLKAFELIGMAVSLARSRMEGSIEVPEVMVRGAVILFSKGLPEYARDLLAEARSLYTLDRTDKTHRHAVTAWLKGCLEYSLGRHLIGYTDWKETRSLFSELSGEAQRERHTEQANWYKARLKDAEIWAVQTFEEVYFQWMNQFEPMFLPGALQEYRKIMDTQFGNKKYRELRKTIQTLLRESKLAPKPEIAWFALVEAAFFEYQMHDTLIAITHLKEAYNGFRLTHRGAVTLWLLGMVRWWLPSQRSDAVLNWEESIALFQTLSKQADQANKQDQRSWYDNQINLMNISLKQWIQLTK
jgi:hypothetical protein